MDYIRGVARGVTRLDSARGKKQVSRPRVRTWAISEANLLLKKVLMTLLGLFDAHGSGSAPPQWFGARGIAPPLPTPFYPLGLVGRERRSHTFFTFCFEMGLKLFQNGYFWVHSHTFLLAQHAWLGIPYVPFHPGQSRFKGFVPAPRQVYQKIPVWHSFSQHSPALVFFNRGCAES